jgi:hypothetical protein
MAWLKLVAKQGMVIRIQVEHVGAIYPWRQDETSPDDDSWANVLIQGQFITVQGSPDLIQTLITKALAQKKAIELVN